MNNIAEFFERQIWTFAKTYADRAPREYIVRGKHEGTDQEFTNAVLLIRENGVPMRFWGKEYIYLHQNNKLYWTMGDPIDETIIINRCELRDCVIEITPVILKNHDL